MSIGVCANCGKRKKLPKKLQAGVPRAHYECDPFCSRVCCEKAHGIEAHPGELQRKDVA